jgi:hypothetical protein
MSTWIIFKEKAYLICCIICLVFTLSKSTVSFDDILTTCALVTNKNGRRPTCFYERDFMLSLSENTQQGVITLPDTLMTF